MNHRDPTHFAYHATVRLPEPMGDDAPQPVTIMTASGHIFATVSAADFKLVSAVPLCPHGRERCFACRHRLASANAATAAAHALALAVPGMAAKIPETQDSGTQHMLSSIRA